MDNTDPSDGERDDAGKFSTKYEPGDFLAALRRLGGAGSTKEIAEDVGCTRRTAHYRLSDLEESGDISSRDVGRSILWQVVDDGR
ncbi:helix-turn-helix transcriptional regulator [Halogeometricum borinquense]|uniref:Helix-turn-helix transcriptional regulator n=1 Tax=Halogeometricum borinquense TaxID=60847 RepID=A0A6C0UHS3_9EURY|nr:winged helix-turn-helix domain-containing protein [Halogeometricum borinquense]QIB74757.1 helix-turn-helix transcriptional regulator [Halogeometricum borinquense]